jgi:nicotinamidase/pyrazinamidase
VTTIIWDVDTQVDFVMQDGRLSVPGAEAILPSLRALTEWAHAKGVRIVATADDHDIGHAEISDTPDWQSTFPLHCMRGTAGQRKVPETALRHPLVIEPVPMDPADVTAAVCAHAGDILINKPGTDVFRWNPNAATVLRALAPDRVIVYGVATDICTKAAIEGIARLLPDAELIVITDAIRGLDAERSKALLEQWRAAGHRLATTADITT